MMDSAVSQSYTFDSNFNDATDLSRQSSKKRRILAERTSDNSLEQFDGWHPAQQQYAPNIHGGPLPLTKYHHSSTQDVSYASTADSIPASTSLSISHSAQSWPQSNAYSVVSGTSYSDVPPFSQPYYHDQVENAPYASSWPPLANAQPATYELASGIYPQADLDSIQYGYSGPSGFASSSSALPVRSGMTPIAAAGPPYTMPIGSESAHTQMLRHSLPSLENVAVPVIHVVIKNNHAQLQSLLQDDMSEAGRLFRNTRFNFEQTRHIFNRDSVSGDAPFISSMSVPEFETVHQDVLRKANIATFILGVIDMPALPLPQLHAHFLPIFVPFQQKLLKWQGLLLLELKTQAYIAALREGQVDNALDLYFPLYDEGPLLARHPDVPTLFPSEREFIDKCRARRQYLLSERQSVTYQELESKYPWTEFVREFVASVGGNINGLLSLVARGQRAQNSTDLRRRATGSTNSPQTIAASTHIPTGPDANDGLYRSGSHGASFDARKSTSTGATVRQPWTKPEEEALLEGLERVNGPHWSQILALYGRGGSINEVLKDRNQVQLKDKARNLKLWHLKMGKEVPDNLKGVTGELRKRGGARARAALEAEEKNARLVRGGSNGAESDGIDPRLNVAGVPTSQTSRI